MCKGAGLRWREKAGLAFSALCKEVFSSPAVPPWSDESQHEAACAGLCPHEIKEEIYGINEDRQIMFLYVSLLLCCQAQETGTKNMNMCSK